MTTALLRLALAIVLLAAPLSGARADGERPFRIYMALWRGWEAAAQGFEDYLTRHKVPHQLIVRDAGQDAGKLPEMVREAKAMKADLVFTWGTTVTLGMLGRYDAVDPKQHITEIPAVFAIVSNPEASGVVPEDGTPRRNVTGTRYLLPLAAQLRLIWSYRPFERIGVVYNPLESNAIAVVEELRQLADTWEPADAGEGGKAPAKGFKLTARPLPLIAGKPDPATIAEAVATLAAEGVDFLYIPPDSFLNVNRDLLSQAAQANRLPTFAAAEAHVRQSRALFTGAYPYYNVGQLTAHKAALILQERAAPQVIPIDAPPKVSIVINIKTARDLDLYPPLALVGIAEVVE